MQRVLSRLFFTAFLAVQPLVATDLPAQALPLAEESDATAVAPPYRSTNSTAFSEAVIDARLDSQFAEIDRSSQSASWLDDSSFWMIVGGMAAMFLYLLVIDPVED